MTEKQKITLPGWMQQQYPDMPDSFKLGVFADYVHLVRDIIGSGYVLQHYENEAGPLAAAALQVASEWRREAPAPAAEPEKICGYKTLQAPRLRCVEPATRSLSHAYGAHADLCDIHADGALATGEWTED